MVQLGKRFMHENIVDKGRLEFWLQEFVHCGRFVTAGNRLTSLAATSDSCANSASRMHLEKIWRRHERLGERRRIITDIALQ
jgi:hypothetical protein